MTVQELIEELKKFPPDLPVIRYDDWEVAQVSTDWSGVGDERQDFVFLY